MPAHPETIHALLLAAQAAIAAAMEMLGAGGPAAPECRHPTMQRLDSPGRPRHYCPDCGIYQESGQPEVNLAWLAKPGGEV